MRAPPVWRALFLLICSFSLLACGSSARSPSPYGQRQDSSAAQQRALDLAARGYPGAPKPSASQLEATTLAVTNQQWGVNGEPLSISLVTPQGESSGLPLLIYLPGLGESATAGAHWRYAWARAGYAVLSFQALEADQTAWSSPLARAADFTALAMQHQQPHLLQARLQLLRGAIKEAKRRVASAEAPWSKVDPERIAVVGYDLGAATAAAWAAELGPASEGHARALIMLSPSGITRAEAQQALSTMPASLPLLAVNSQRAADLTGVLTSAAERTRFFEQLPADANKYLLLLNTPSHAALAGSSGMAESPNEPTANGSSRRAPAQVARGPAQPYAVMSPAPPPILSDRGNQEAGVAVEHISIAFLNTHLRGNPHARHWLQQSASVWLKGLAEWRLR
jgi:pimeloyl-ACP methyl ester carboxylesterase